MAGHAAGRSISAAIRANRLFGCAGKEARPDETVWDIAGGCGSLSQRNVPHLFRGAVGGKAEVAKRVRAARPRLIPPPGCRGGLGGVIRALDRATYTTSHWYARRLQSVLVAQ